MQFPAKFPYFYTRVFLCVRGCKRIVETLEEGVGVY